MARSVGIIPPTPGELTNLRVLLLQDNRLSGPIQPELSLLAGPRLLALNGNQLVGQVPAAVGALTRPTALSAFCGQPTGWRCAYGNLGLAEGVNTVAHKLGGATGALVNMTVRWVTPRGIGRLFGLWRGMVSAKSNPSVAIQKYVEKPLQNQPYTSSLARYRLLVEPGSRMLSDRTQQLSLPR